MRNEIEILESLLFPLINEKESNFIKRINWDAFISGLIMYEKNPKPIYTEIYKLQLINPEEVISKLPDLYDSFLENLAEEYTLGHINSSVISLMKTQNSNFEDKVAFFKVLENVVKKQEREKIIKELPNLSNKVNFTLTDTIISSVVKKKAREDLKNKFGKWDKELENEKENENTNSFEIDLKDRTDESLILDFNIEKKGKVISLSWIKYLATAAILVLAFFIWQPTQSSDNELFAYYSANLESLTKGNFSSLETEILNSNERGDDFILNNYSKIETEKALSGLSYFKAGNYDRAKKIFTELNPKEHNSQILFFLALSQLNTNDIDASILNLEYLLIQPIFNYSDDVKFHLAMGYLKKGSRNKSKILLKELISSDSKIGEDANLILKEMRWF